MSRSEKAWIGIDLGTQGVRCTAVSESGQVLASASHPLVSRRFGVEHTQNPLVWWEAVCACCRRMAETVSPEAMQGLAVDATSGTILLTDDQLRPVCDALMYDDSRAVSESQQVQIAGQALWAELGYSIQPSWAIAKLLWLSHAAGSNGLRGRHLTHENDFINQRFTRSRVASDWSHSLKTGYDLIRLRWPIEMFAVLGLPESIFPQVVSPGTVVGSVCAEAASETRLPKGLPVISGMTDGCAAQISSGAIEIGSWNSVLGTTLVIKGVTVEHVRDPLGAVYSHRSRDQQWLPGGASSTGAGIITQQFPGADLDQLNTDAQHRGVTPVVMYPLASRGERFPFFAPEAAKFLLGSPRDDIELYRAILQGVAFIERLSFDYLKMLGASVSGGISISGGAVRSSLWNHLRASILGRPLNIAAESESAFGMAILAASHSSSLKQAVASMVPLGRVIEPTEDFASIYAESYRALLRELEDRGWLGHELAAFSIGRISSNPGESA